MRYREFYYRWEWQLRASPEALWPLVSDTNRFNRDTDVPALEQGMDNGSLLTNGRRRLRFLRLGIPVEWEEEPFEWIRPHRFGVGRRYVHGPVAEMRVLADLTAEPDGGTRLVYQVWAQPKNPLGLIAIPVQIGLISARNFDASFRRYDQLAAEGKSFLDLPTRVRFAPGGRTRLTTLRDALLAQGAAPNLVARLAQTLEQADDLTLARLRPYALADYWGVSRRAVLELCLWATRIGLLEFRWELLCPLCRGAKQTRSSLRDVQSQVHCDVCHIDFTVNFDHSVELTFRPNPAVREIEGREFCVGGPQVTPHIVAQQLLPAGAQEALRLPLEAGRYRLRTLDLPGGQFLRVAPDGLAEATLRASADGWPHEEIQVAPLPTLRFENATSREQLFSLERTAWSDQAVTAAEVTALQLFRDLFANEALRPGEQISVGSLTVAFTDLHQSTRLYREIGDAPAFGLVMNHFDVLREAIAAEGGTVVKTLGDSVMAVFRRPVAALRAIQHAQQVLASPPAGVRPLWLKAGVHSGPCIAVTLNDRLDYFGATVNVAARLVDLCSGGDVVISGAVRNDPEVADWLAEPGFETQIEPVEAVLKGFDAERFELWRVRGPKP
jgi:class 3 adenylate cyclase